jgi:F420-dependent oxidoreductase-like protein
MVEPQQGATYADQLEVAQASERCGFGAFFRSDHYLAMVADGSPGPTDSWVTLAGLARETSSIRLGTMVTSATFRLPGVLAIQVAQVDQMSGGRVELGLGSGWFEAEHAAYGIPFPPVAERFDRLEEQLEIVTGLWGTEPGARYSFDGRHYRLSDSPALPKPVQQPPPVVIGGMGKRRTPELAARFAAEFNIPFQPLAAGRAQYGRVRLACEKAGRDPDSLLLSVALTAAVGHDDAETGRRAAAIGQDLAGLQADGLAGTPDQVVDRLGRWSEAGATRCYLQVLDLQDFAHLELIAARVAPQLS